MFLYTMACMRVSSARSNFNSSNGKFSALWNTFNDPKRPQKSLRDPKRPKRNQKDPKEHKKAQNDTKRHKTIRIQIILKGPKRTH